MNASLHNAPGHASAASAAGMVSWKQPVMAFLVFAMFGPMFAAPLTAIVWALSGMLNFSTLALEIAEVVALVIAAAPTAWLARNAWRVEGRMARGEQI